MHSKPIIDQRSAADACATEDRIHVNGEMRTQGASESWRVGACERKLAGGGVECAHAEQCPQLRRAEVHISLTQQRRRSTLLVG